jgi:hypothetical protein
MDLNTSDKKVIAQLENLTLAQARRELASGTFGRPGSGNHDFASSWLSVKEAEERDKREAESLSISRRALSMAKIANIWAAIATLIATIAMYIAYIE